MYASAELFNSLSSMIGVLINMCFMAPLESVTQALCTLCLRNSLLQHSGWNFCKAASLLGVCCCCNSVSLSVYVKPRSLLLKQTWLHSRSPLICQPGRKQESDLTHTHKNAIDHERERERAQQMKTDSQSSV